MIYTVCVCSTSVVQIKPVRERRAL